MLLQLIRNGFDKETLIMVLLSIPVIVFSLSFHEFSHAFSANLMGDYTAKAQGRMSLNPKKHLDPIGALLMLVCGFGWAKPVPINPYNFRRKNIDAKWGMAISSLAGPISNLLLGFASYILFYGSFMLYFNNGNKLFYVFALLFEISAMLNVHLAVFNLLPIPPLDGSRILFTFLPQKYYFKIMQYERYISIIIMVLLVTGSLTTPLSFISNAILNSFDAFAKLIF